MEPPNARWDTQQSTLKEGKEKLQTIRGQSRELEKPCTEATAGGGSRVGDVHNENARTPDNAGTIHFSGIYGVDSGTENITKYVLQKLGRL